VLTIEPGKRYILRWQVYSATAGTTEPQEATVDVHRVENGYVHGYVGQARLDYLPLARVLSAVPA
jgi:hypothetical protein